MKSRMKWYVGAFQSGKRDIFQERQTPTFSSHGSVFMYVIGPFSTKKGAVIMAAYGRNNPHLQTVYDAEEMARRRPEMVEQGLRIIRR